MKKTMMILTSVCLGAIAWNNTISFGQARMNAII